jgi:hypothetical protein
MLIRLLHARDISTGSFDAINSPQDPFDAGPFGTI